MDYIYGVTRRRGRVMETLKTVGESHTDYRPGTLQTVREYPDQTITDVCRVKEKYLSAEDSQGRCYDWYEIEGHYRYSQLSHQTRETIEGSRDAVLLIEDAVCELDMNTEERLSAMEDALCELDAIMNGGMSNE